ncbi:GntR family transcriptional regulator [Chachezhania sediminis]|uniref:GntR family transcriptional regulator n=1 Tax=Chachezhania sediminis TaxID=2599291 RepID=UPI00131AA412|nr:GntR family transcriptional regulator [Chachezhania sediminis]
MAGTRRASYQSHLNLAKQVVGVVFERGLKTGDHLPEKLFSDACQVSRTPMRSAFKILESQGILEWQQERGYFLAVDSPDDIDAALSDLEGVEGSLPDRILADRADRRLGEIQSVSALSRRYDASRSTVLFALTVLAREGLVTQLPGRAWAFQPMIDSARAVTESFEMRLVMEPLALTSPGFALDGKKATQIRAQMEDFLRLDDSAATGARFRRTDIDFHVLIAESSSNRFARSALLAHHRLRLASRKDGTIPAYRMRKSMEEHLEILDSVDRRQYDLAADLMVVHLRRSAVRRPEAANRGISPLLRG